MIFDSHKISATFCMLQMFCTVGNSWGDRAGMISPEVWGWGRVSYIPPKFEHVSAFWMCFVLMMVPPLSRNSQIIKTDSTTAIAVNKVGDVVFNC